MADAITGNVQTPSGATVNATSGQLISGPSPISADSLSSPTSPITVPSTPTATNAMATNLSVPSPSSLVNQTYQPTAAEGQQSDFLKQLADLTGSAQSADTYKYNAENAAGIPQMTKTVNDLSTQLNGLNDQAAYLSQIAPTTIENQAQQAATGRGMTTGGLQPLTAAQLRENQIKQAGIAAQALTTKSALYAAQGNLSLAQNAADKAAQVKFDAQQQQIDYHKALLDAIKPQLDRDQAARAATLQVQLQDRQTAINLQMENYKTAQAAIADALKNNPDSAQAHAAAQQAMQLDPHDPQYLQKVQGLVSPFASDVAARQLDLQSKTMSIALNQAQLQQIPLDAALKRAQIVASQTSTALNAQQLKNLTDLSTGQGLGQYIQLTSKGGQFINSDNIADAKMKAAVEKNAREEGVTILNKDAAGKLQAIDDTRTNLDQIKNTFNQFAYTNAFARDTVGMFGFGKTLKDFFQSDQNISSFKSWRSAAINSIQALAGGQGSGLRINQAEIDAAIHNDIPDIKDTTAIGQQKLTNLNKQLDSWENEILKPTLSAQPTGQTGTLANGTTVTRQADGSIRDAQGNKYDEQGNRI